MTVAFPDLKLDFDLIRHDEFQDSFQKKRINDVFDDQLSSNRIVQQAFPKHIDDSIKSDSLQILEQNSSKKVPKFAHAKTFNHFFSSVNIQNKSNIPRNKTQHELLLEKNPNEFKKIYPLMFSNIKNFISRLRNLGNLRNFKNLNEKEIEIINDLSFCREERKKSKQELIFELIPKKVQEKLIKKLNYLKNKCEPFHPYGFKLIWDFFNTIIIVLLLFYIPISITFKIEFLDHSYQMLYFMTMLFDMVVQINTFHFENGIEVRRRKKILEHYFITRFWPDFLAIIGLFVELFSPASYFLLLYFLKIGSLLSLNDKIMNRFQFSHKTKGIKDLIMLFFLILLITHLIACAWSFISGPTFEFNKNNLTWIKENQIETREWYITYLYAYYWAIITVMTVGYGDVIPKNDIERLFVLVTTLFACMLFAYSINTIGVIVQDINKDNTKFKFFFVIYAILSFL